MIPGRLVTDLETSKRLKKVGWNMETYFRHMEYDNGYNNLWTRDQEEEYSSGKGVRYLAPTFQEIYEELPAAIVKGSLTSYKFLDEFQALHLVGYDKGLREDDVNYLESLPEAAAEAWIWCVENGYLEINLKA